MINVQVDVQPVSILPQLALLVLLQVVYLICINLNAIHHAHLRSAFYLMDNVQIVTLVAKHALEQVLTVLPVYHI